METKIKYPKVVQLVVDYINEVRNEFSDITDSMLENNGAIGYYNGNDGTDFDWKLNNRLCEFGIGVADGSVFAFKCLVYRDGEAEIYCYPHGEMQPVKKVTRKLLSENQTKSLKQIMMKNADNLNLYDKYLHEIFAK